MNRFSWALCGLLALSNIVLDLGSATPLLGTTQCTYGPSYWCENIPQAKQCKAVSHCIQTVWETHKYPVDTDEVCQICMDMVKQARDQLRSNETQEDLKAVFEGSCKLIPIKLVRKECIEMADDFVPELVEALSSQMDPTAVCTVSGMCNNAKIDQLLLEYSKKALKHKRPSVSVTVDEAAPADALQDRYPDFRCKDCRSVADHIVGTLRNTSEADMQMRLLRLCRHTGSFSDSCASLVVTETESIHQRLIQIHAEDLCDLSGACSLHYHRHDTPMPAETESVQITPMSNVGYVEQAPIADVPCELCKKLIIHLRDVVLANATKEDFEKVLVGICKQVRKPKMQSECLNLAQNFGGEIYDALRNGLDSQLVCGIIGICTSMDQDVAMVPMFPMLNEHQLAKTAVVKKTFELGKNEPKFTKAEKEAFQLPIDQLMGPQNAHQLVDNGQWCSICEMVLHFVQQALAEPTTEEQIKATLTKACDVLPKAVNHECIDFVNSYGDAVLAMLIQDVDPSTVCPSLKMCSRKQKPDVEIFAVEPLMNVDIQSNDKPTCPLCLFAVSEAKARIESDPSIENIKHTLDTLCTHLPAKLRVECVDFVDSYTKELIDLLMKNYTPQQICVKLKLCTEKPKTGPPAVPATVLPQGGSNEDNDILTNEIADNTYNGKVIVKGHLKRPEWTDPAECFFCVSTVEEAEKHIKDLKSRDEIKRFLDTACDGAPSGLKDKCVNYMAKNGEHIIELVLAGATPKQLCKALQWCSSPPAFEEQRVESLEPEDMIIDEAFSIDFISLPAMMVPPPPAPPMQTVTRAEEVDDLTAEVGSNEGCILCEFIMSTLEKDLNDKKTDDAIRKAIDGVCDKMPKSVSKSCRKFVDNYVEMILVVLATTPPAKVCAELKVCTPPHKQAIESVILEAKKDVIECAVCQSAITFVDQLLEDPDFDHNLEVVVEKVCETIPKVYRAKCREMVEAYGPSMINLLLTKAQPERVCEQIQLCFPNEYSTFVQLGNDTVVPSRIRRSTELLGANDCTYGPTSWCKSLKNAKKCNAEKFCMDNNWNGVPPSE